MNIKDIAKIAGVSASTVSKVLNQKDAGISEQTRQKVLAVVREYQYVPYSNVNTKKDRTFLLGLGIFSTMEGYREFLNGAQCCADEYNYNIVLSNINEDEENNRKRISVLARKQLDGLLLDQRLKQYITEETVVHTLLDFSGEEAEQHVSMNYESAGYLAVERLYEEQNRNIAVIVPDKGTIHERVVVEGISQACFEKGIPFNQNRVIRNTESLVELRYKLRELTNKGVSSFICVTTTVTKNIIDILNEDGRLNEEISVIGIGEKLTRKVNGKEVDWIHIPYHHMGYIAIRNLIELIENDTILDRSERFIQPEVIFGGSIANKKNKKRILVAGSINMDVMISVPKIPQSGEVVLSDNSSLIPGGKGANQAIGASKLGADVAIIGKIGNDQEGKIIQSTLIENNVNIAGMMIENDVGTGKAYINVPSDGDSSLVVYSGANKRINSDYIYACEHLFEKQEYCLVQTEIPLDAVQTVTELSAKHQVKVILKPSAIDTISTDILRNVFIFVPNEKELHNLHKETVSLEEKAAYFIQQGVKHVIITLGEKGCYYTDGTQQKYYKSTQFEAVDTTGAADAFISGLAVYLSEGNTMERSIQFATYCAGISVTREGVQPALPDRMSLQLYTGVLDEI